MKDTQIPFGQCLENIISDKVSGYDYPVAFGFPIGHEIPNYAIPLMGEVKLKVDSGISQLSFFEF